MQERAVTLYGPPALPRPCVLASYLLFLITVMVLRKPSPAGGALPYPVTPISPQPTQIMASSPLPQQDTFSSAHPPSSAFDTPPFVDAEEHGNRDQANPWADTVDEEQRINRSLPTVLRAGSAPRSTEELQLDRGLSGLPRWGEAGAVTPRSSSDSQSSRDLWEDDEVDDAETEEVPQNGGSWQSEGLRVPNALGDRSTLLSHSAPSLPGLSTVKRKPLASSESSQPSPGARSPSYDFASNNPFRKLTSSTDLPRQDQPVQEDSQEQPGRSDEPDLLERKGKEIIRDPPADGTPVQMTANLSLDDRPFEEYSTSYRPSNINLNGA